MNARASQVLGSAEQAVVITPARPWDIFFLLSEVASGAADKHFNQEYCGFQSLKLLALRCLKAILGRPWGHRRLVERNQFVVARIAHVTVGAAFISVRLRAGGQRVRTLECLVVDARFRQRGIGGELVSHLISSASEEAQLECWCTPKSLNMQRLLRRFGFKCKRKSLAIPLGHCHVVIPAKWIRNTQRNHMPRREHPANAPLSSERSRLTTTVPLGTRRFVDAQFHPELIG